MAEDRDSGTKPPEDLSEDPFEHLAARAFALESGGTSAISADVPAPAFFPYGTLRTEAEGRFQVVEEIARGGMGVVLKAHDTDLGRDVAMKVLRDEHTTNPAAYERFVEEAQIAGQLQHPGVTPIYEVGLRADRRPYFTMRLVDGDTLAVLLDAREDATHGRRRFLAIFEKVLETLAYAHSRDVVHRDLKPSNIMVGAYGDVQVMDWGLAKVLPKGGADADGSSPDATLETVRSGTPGTLSEAGSVMGTLSYMSPEQARGEVGQIGKRSDVFALGGILCEILTGKPTYPGATTGEIREKASAADLDETWSRLEASSTDPGLQKIVRDCLAVTPESRPSDAAPVSQVFSRYLADLEEQARLAEITAAEARARVVQERKARRLSVALAALVVLALVIGGATYVVTERNHRERVAKTNHAVEDAMREATTLRANALASASPDLARWKLTHAAATKAVELASSGEADETTRVRAGKLLKEIETDQARAGRIARQAETDRAMVTELEALRTGGGGVWGGWASTDRQHAEAFKRYGIDVDALGVDEAAKRIRASKISTRLVVALDEWNIARREAGHSDGAKQLFHTAQAAEADAWLRAVRQAADAADVGGLQKLASEPTVLEKPKEAVVSLANTLGWRGDVKGAIKLLRNAQALHADDFWTNMLLGYWLLHHQPSQPDEAVRFFTAGVATRPEHQVGWTNLAHGLMQKGDAKGSEQAARRAIDVGSDYAPAHVNLGVALEKQGDRGGAIAAFRRATEIDPELALAHNNLGINLFHQGDLAGAADAFREAARCSPDDVDARKNLGVCLQRLADLDGALDAYRSASRLDPQNPAYLNAVASTLYSLGRFAEAARAAAKVVGVQPTHAGGLNVLAASLAATGRGEEAVGHYRQLLEATPASAVGHLNLGRQLQGLGRLEEALAILERGNQLASTDPRLRDQAERSLRECRRMATLDSKLPAILRGEQQATGADVKLLARLCHAKKRYAASARFWHRVLTDAPGEGDEHNAASAAARAAAGEGDAVELPEPDRARWRQQALDWLVADVAAKEKRVEKATPAARNEMRRSLGLWRCDADLASLRDEERLAELTAAQQRACREFWARVDELITSLERSAAATTEEK